MNPDRQSKYVILIWGMATGFTVFCGGYLDTYMPYKEAWQSYLILCSSDGFLGAILGMLVSIYALALPLTLNTISDNLSLYGDTDVISWFYKKWEVYYQRVVLPFFITYLIIILFGNINNGLACVIVCVFAIYTLYITFRYFRIITRISVDTEAEMIKWSSELAQTHLE